MKYRVSVRIVTHQGPQDADVRYYIKLRGTNGDTDEIEGKVILGTLNYEFNDTKNIGRYQCAVCRTSASHMVRIDEV